MTTSRALFVFLVCFYGLLAGGHTYSTDEEGVFATTRSLVEERSVAIRISPDNDAVVPTRVGRDNERVGGSGIGESVVAIPLYLFGRGVAAFTDPGGSRTDEIERIFVGWTNSIVTALGSVFVYLIARLLGTARSSAVALALSYGVATMALPYAKTLFTEPLTATLTLGAVFYAVSARSSRSPLDSFWSGVLAAGSLFARPSAALFGPIVAAYLLWDLFNPATRRSARSVAGAFVAGSAPTLALYVLSNWWRFGSPTDLGYRGELSLLDYPIADGMVGLFLSPGKSLFLYAPVAALGLVALPRVWRRWPRETILFLAIGLSNALFFAHFRAWHGDNAWGPRYLMMSLPFFILPVAPTLVSAGWRYALLFTSGLGLCSALLGAALYFNEYFAVVGREVGASTVDGWAADEMSASGSGIEGVSVFLDGPPGFGRYLGAAAIGDVRSDVAAVYGPQFANSGWHFTWDRIGLSPGRHALVVVATSLRSERSGIATREFNIIPTPGAVPEQASANSSDANRLPRGVQEPAAGAPAVSVDDPKPDQTLYAAIALGDLRDVMHWNPYWSPLAGHARELPGVARETLRVLSGLPSAAGRYPDTTNERIHWYARVPQLDIWPYWIVAADLPTAPLLMLLPMLVGIAYGGRRLMRSD